MHCRNCGNTINNLYDQCDECNHIGVDGTSYCFNCGELIRTDSDICIKCEVNTNIQHNTVSKKEGKDTGLAIASLIIPLYGVVYYFGNRKTVPAKSKNALKWSFINALIIILFMVFVVLAYFVPMPVDNTI